MRPSFFHHLHPPTIPAAQSRWRYTLGAGGTAVYLVVVLIFTGILEMFYYIPTPEAAGASIQTITFLVPFGGILRNLHFWAAQLLVIVVVIHLLRVIFTGAYAPPRRFNYLLGLILLVLCLFLDFTGYILRWDEGIYWALVAGTNLVATIPFLGPSLYTFVTGGSQTGPATLIRFYAWHTFGLTLILAGIGGWHLFRVRRDGGIAVAPPQHRSDPARISRFDLVRREGLAMLVVMIILLLMSTFFPAPLAAPITENTSLANDSGAPWFFLWVQQLLKLGNPFLMGVFFPAIVLIFLALIPYFLPGPRREELGRWLPRGNRIARVIVAAIVCVLMFLTVQAAYFS
jgi:quinol-cytochrome oxidoreductase complex cytochrome b subunit